jgi:hypothetical protein
MAVPTSLSNRARTFLTNLARRGDYTAQGVVYGAGSEDVKGSPVRITLTDVPAKNATVLHANVFGDAAPVAPDTKVRVTVSTNPTFARNVSCTFGADWDGGDVLVEGTDQFGKAASDTIVASVGNAVYGTKIFKTVTRMSYTGSGTDTHATNVVSLGTGDKLACGTVKLQSDNVQVFVAGVQDVSTIDLTYSAFTPSASNLADGSKDFEVFANA